MTVYMLLDNKCVLKARKPLKFEVNPRQKKVRDDWHNNIHYIFQKMGNNKITQYKLGYMLTQARANALSIITNMVYPNGQCEYDHYVTIFDTPP